MRSSSCIAGLCLVPGDFVPLLLVYSAYSLTVNVNDGPCTECVISSWRPCGLSNIMSRLKSPLGDFLKERNLYWAGGRVYCALLSALPLCSRTAPETKLFLFYLQISEF